MPYQSTKRGRKVEGHKRRGYGFHWYGRDDKGVHIWNGQSGALKWGARILGVLGITLVCSSAAAVIFGAPPSAAATVAGAGSIHSILAYTMFRQLKRINELATPEQVSQEMGIDKQSIEEAIEERGIRPRMIINGEPFFDPSDLGEAATLLRSAPPPEPESLLRASICDPTDSVTLLKPVTPESALTDYATSKTESAESVELRSQDA